MARVKNAGVQWTLPGRKRPFASTTVATSDLIGLMAKDGHTVNTARRAINFDPEAQDVLATLSRHGYGDTPLCELVSALRMS